jgi:hypothetical protein
MKLKIDKADAESVANVDVKLENHTYREPK